MKTVEICMATNIGKWVNVRFMCNKDKVEGKYYFELKDELDMKRADRRFGIASRI